MVTLFRELDSSCAKIDEAVRMEFEYSTTPVLFMITITKLWQRF